MAAITYLLPNLRSAFLIQEQDLKTYVVFDSQLNQSQLSKIRLRTLP